MEVSWITIGNGTDSVRRLKCGDYDLSRLGQLQNDNAVVQTFNCVLNAPTALVAVLGNLLVIISIWRTPSMHNPGNVLLCSLAMSDFNVGLLTQPFFLSYTIAQMRGLPETFCSTAVALGIVGCILGTVSLLTVTAISFDRFLALRLHLSYNEIVTVKRVITVVVGIWITCIAGSITMIWPPTRLVFAIFYPAVVFLTLSSTLFTYCRVFQVVRYHQAQIQAQAVGGEHSSNIAQIRKSALNVFLVFCILLLCYLPFLCAAVVVGIKGMNVSTQSVYEITWSFMLINSCLNPLVYCWRITGIRRAVLATLKKLRNSLRC